MEYWWLLLHWCHNLILFSASYRRQVLVCLRFAASQHAGVPTQPETLPAMLQLNHAGSFKKLKSSQVQAVRGIWFARVFCFHAPQVFFYRIFDSVVLPYFLPKPKFFRWKVGASSGAKRRLRRLLPHRPLWTLNAARACRLYVFSRYLLTVALYYPLCVPNHLLVAHLLNNLESMKEIYLATSCSRCLEHSYSNNCRLFCQTIW